MYIIKMNNDKSLLTTQKTHIYRGEKDIDIIRFLIPQTYGGKDMSACRLFVRYVLPNGSGYSEELAMSYEPYKTYYSYELVVSSRITYESGTLEMWLTAIDPDNNIILKSGTVQLEIEKHPDITGSLSEEDSDQLDAIEAELARIDREKADDWIYFDDDFEMQLLADGSPIGTRMNVKDIRDSLPADAVEFDNEIPSADTGDGNNP